MLSPVAAHRRFLHQIPELDDQLPQTLMLVSGVLRGHRCEHFSPIPGSVCAWFDFGRKETVAFRADMDALPVHEATGLPYSSRHPGQMHACGHDGHTAMALSLCQWLSELKASGRELPPRNILVIFQPAEETTGGADRICAAGVLDEYKVRRIFGLHLWPGVPEGVISSRPGPLMARSNEITVHITGKSVHLSRANEGHDAMLAGVEYLQRAYQLAESAPPPCILRFGKMVSGTVRNALSGETTMEGSLRTYREETYNQCRSELSELGVSIAKETECAVQVLVSGGYPAVWNDEALYEMVCTGLGEDAPVPLDTPSLAAEDFSFYQKYIPGIFFFLGVGNTAPLHSPEFDFNDEKVLPVGVEFMKKLAYLP